MRSKTTIVNQSQVGFPCVITSYSIHYTKLYDGYVIGGVAPLGHANPVRLVLDQDLLQFESVWAAAGTPFSIFPLPPAALQALSGAQWEDVAAE